MCFSNCYNVFCVNGSEVCLVEAKFCLVCRWKSCMLSHWLLTAANVQLIMMISRLSFSVFRIWRRCDAMLDVILAGYILLWYLGILFNDYLWNNLWSVYFKTSGWEIEFHYEYSCFFFLLSCVYSHLQEEYGAIEVIKLNLLELHKCPLNDTHCWHLWMWEAAAILFLLEIV